MFHLKLFETASRVKSLPDHAASLARQSPVWPGKAPSSWAKTQSLSPLGPWLPVFLVSKNELWMSVLWACYPWKRILFAEPNTQGLGNQKYLRKWKLKHLEVSYIFGIDNSRPWKCILFSELGTQGLVSVLFTRLKTQRPRSVIILCSETEPFWELKTIDLEVYTLFGTENLMPWKCVLFSELERHGLGTVHYFWDWKLKASKLWVRLCSRGGLAGNWHIYTHCLGFTNRLSRHPDSHNMLDKQPS